MLGHHHRAQYFRLFCVNIDQYAANIGKWVVSLMARLIITLISSIVAKCDKDAFIIALLFLLALRIYIEELLINVYSLASQDLL